jgi:3-deoxy-D-manno-octulosonate 8-phosphate phosphatase KdsC-like HAD superfamily phosphatase
VKKECLCITPSKAGRGAVREAVEFLLKGQGRWDQVVEDAYKRGPPK